MNGLVVVVVDDDAPLDCYPASSSCLTSVLFSSGYNENHTEPGGSMGPPHSREKFQILGKICPQSLCLNSISGLVAHVAARTQPFCFHGNADPL